MKKIDYTTKEQKIVLVRKNHAHVADELVDESGKPMDPNYFTVDFAPPKGNVRQFYMGSDDIGYELKRLFPSSKENPIMMYLMLDNGNMPAKVKLPEKIEGSIVAKRNGKILVDDKDWLYMFRKDQ